MYPHTPQDRRTFESPDWTPPDQSDRTRIEDRTRFAGTSMMVSCLLLVAILALIVLL